MNKQKGNMYPFVTHTHNAIMGKCSHDCIYCYMKVFPQGELRLSEKKLKENLGKDNYIFIGSSTDVFADSVPREWILKVLMQCETYDNTYLFQTKNPKRFKEFLFPIKTILGITLETTAKSPSKAPTPYRRYKEFVGIYGLRKMVSIEPIIDFNLEMMIYWIKDIKPEFVSIGADSKGHKLNEPPKEKIELLIKELKKFTEVKIKDNLKRLN